MSKYVTDTLIQTLSDVTDLQRVLDDHQMSAAQLLNCLRTARGRQQLKARRQLAKIHSELVAHRFSPYAVHKLCQLLSDDKSELRLKGAMSILAVSGLAGKPTRAAKKKESTEPVREPTAEDGEVLVALAEVLAQRRAAEQAINGGAVAPGGSPGLSRDDDAALTRE
jgi:hypothetical protein